MNLPTCSGIMAGSGTCLRTSPLGAAARTLRIATCNALELFIVARNYRMASGHGEVDLIGWERGTLVFVEVKSRHSEEYGAPDRAIGREKESSLLRAAREYARHADVPWENVRFDVVNVVFATPPLVTHFRDVFGPPAA
jgi:putative endonuclease